MTVSPRTAEAVIVLPDAAHGLVREPSLRRWLARSALTREELPAPVLQRVRQATGQPDDGGGLAALRLWGQTGDRPAVWVAAADPVYLEAGLARVRLHRLWSEELPPGDLRQLFDELDSVLGDERTGFACIGEGGYLRSDEPLPTPCLSPENLNGLEAEEFLPRGASAAGYMQLLSEVQMTLHGSQVARRRESEGRRPVNSLWVWGGGLAPEVRARDIPPLLSDDPTLRGYWLSAGGEIGGWPGSLMVCAETAPRGFVCAVPDRWMRQDEHVTLLSSLLSDARRILHEGPLRKVTLLFRDGLAAQVRRRHAWRIWRSESSLISAAGAFE